MPELFDRDQIEPNPLRPEDRITGALDICVDPDGVPPELPAEYIDVFEEITEDILQARKNNKPVILTYGAHAIKNGCGNIMIGLIELGYVTHRGCVTHLATNGAGAIHDWEFAYLGRTEENVRRNVQTGDFGTWNETGLYMNLAIILGAAQRRGYGESIGKLIHENGLQIPSTEYLKCLLREPEGIPESWCQGGIADLLVTIEKYGERFKIPEGKMSAEHPYDTFSVQQAAYSFGVPYTVHPGIGYDIIYTHPICCEAAIGRAGQIDFVKFADSVANLEGGVYLSVGSAEMSPRIFQNALFMARMQGKEMRDFRIAVCDTNQEGRFREIFDRTEADRLDYVWLDNRIFLHNLYHMLRDKEQSNGF